jgi:hypothetical protein
VRLGERHLKINEFLHHLAADLVDRADACNRSHELDEYVRWLEAALSAGLEIFPAWS